MVFLNGIAQRAAGVMTMRIWLCLLLLAFVAGMLAGGKLQRMIDAQQAVADLKAEAKATDKQAIRTADTNADARRETATADVTNEGQGHVTQERIRTVYRTRYVPADCRQPDGVRSVLDEAIGRANDRVRAGSGVAPAGVPDR